MEVFSQTFDVKKNYSGGSMKNILELGETRNQDTI